MDTPLRALIADALAWHEIGQGRERQAHRLSAPRADAVLAALYLDHAVLPRTVVERVLTDYVTDCHYGGITDHGLDEMAKAYAMATGWTAQVGESV